MKNKLAAQLHTDAAFWDMQRFADEPAATPEPTPAPGNEPEPTATPPAEPSTPTTPEPEPAAAKPKPEPKAEPKAGKEEPTPAGAPEQYADFTVPEGFTAPMDAFAEFAKAQNMTQDQAQAAVDFYVNQIEPKVQEQQQAMVEQWAADSKKEFGQRKIDQAVNTLGKFASPEFKQFLDESGLGNHPEMVRTFVNIAQKISDAGFIDGISFNGNSGPDYFPDLPSTRKGR